MLLPWQEQDLPDLHIAEHTARLFHAVAWGKLPEPLPITSKPPNPRTYDWQLDINEHTGINMGWRQAKIEQFQPAVPMGYFFEIPELSVWGSTMYRGKKQALITNVEISIGKELLEYHGHFNAYESYCESIEPDRIWRFGNSARHPQVRLLKSEYAPMALILGALIIK
jgi:hypothetical protein